jgi:hypothetical protein
MAASIREVAPGQVEIREGGGAIALFGLPFLAAGVFTILGALAIVSFSRTAGTSVHARPVVALMGAAFVVAGGALVFGRKWTTLDTTNRRIVRQWGALVPLREDVTALDEYAAVTIGFVKGDSETADKFPVALKGRAGEAGGPGEAGRARKTGADVVLFAPSTYAEARAGAVVIARHLHVDLEDATTDHPTCQAFDQLDRSFQSHSQRTGFEPGVEQPANLRSEIVRDADSVEILIPPAQASGIALVAALAPLVIPVIFGPMLLKMFAQPRTPDWSGRVFLGLFVFGFVGLPVLSCLNALVRSRRSRTLVLASRDGILVRQRGILLTKTTASIEAADIVDVDYSTRESASAAARRVAERQATSSGHAVTTTPLSPRTERVLLALARFAKSGGITVKTTRGLTTFGEGLEDDEVRYLHFVIRRALRA